MRRDLKSLDLFVAHRGDLLNYATSIVGDHSRAEDVVQEAWLRFHAAGDAHLRQPLGYLYRIVRNLALDGRRQQAREERYFTAGGAAQAEWTPDDRPSPEVEAGARAEMRALEATVADLPERSRVALQMHCFSDCTLKEIAAYLGISVGSAHALVVDGLEHCRTRLRRSSS